MAGLVALLFLLLFPSLSVWAQFTSTLQGTVTDPTGAVVPNATVTVKDTVTGITRTVQTSAAGVYFISSLPASTFDLTVSATGFKTSLRQGIRLEGAQVKGLDITLELGATATEVTVTGAPPAVETAEAKVSSRIDNTSVTNLPMVARNMYSLVVLTAGITGLPSGGGQAYAQATADIFSAEYGVNLSANGQRPESNAFQVDSGSSNGAPRGGVTNLTPNADAIQELRVSINNFSAEYGRNSSSVTNVVTRSGTNNFHGTIGEFFTDDHLTSGNIFQPPTIPRYNGSLARTPVFIRNEGNWSLGGPIRKDHTFFFGSMDFLRSGSGFTNVGSVVTPDFTNYMEANYPNNKSTYVMKSFLPIGSSLGVSQTVGDVMSTYYGTTCTGSNAITTPIGSMPCDFPLVENISSNQTIPRNGLQWNARIDQSFGSGSNRLYGNWFRTSRQATFSTSIYPAFTMPEPEYTDYLNVNFTHIFSPTVLFETAITVTRARGDVNLSHSHPEIPNLSVPGITSYGMGFTGPTFIQTNGEWRNVLSWNRGTHAFKFGENYGHDDGWGSGAHFAGEYTRYFYGFNTLFDFANDQVFSESHYGYNPSTGTQGSYAFEPVEQRLGAFANDDWKVRHNVTLNLGLRWEMFLNPYEQQDKPKGLFSRMVFNGGDNFSERIANASMIQGRPENSVPHDNFMPRVGFAWDPTGKGKVSIRAGYGMFYNRQDGQFWHDCCVQLPMFAVISASGFTSGIKPVYGFGTSTVAPYGYPPMTGVVAGLDSRGGVIGASAGLQPWDPNMKNEYAENWFLGVQYALTDNWIIEGNYVGSEGHHLYAGYDVNRYDGDLLGPVVQTGTDSTGSPVYGVLLKRLNSSFGSIDYGQANGYSYYYGGNFTVKRRFSRGLDFQAAYTVGKAKDTSSSFGTGLSIADLNNLKLNYGLSDFDVRQKLAASFVYDFPGPKGPGAKSKLLGGWQAGAVVIFQKGTPYSVFCGLPFEPVYDKPASDPSRQVIGNTGCDYNADGFSYDFTMTPSFGRFKSGSKQQFLNGIFQASDFPTPAFGQEGDLGRNSYIGPGYIDTDFNIVKSTSIPWLWHDEAAKFQFRIEAFNLFNNVNLQNPDGSLTDGTFGKSTGVFPSRNIQFGLKIIF